MRKKRRALKKGLGYTISRICILLAVPLLLVGVVLLAVSLFKNGISFGSSKFPQMPFTLNDPFACTENAYLYIKDGVFYYDSIGGNSKDSSYSINTTDVEIEASRSTVALYNRTSIATLEASASTDGLGDIKKVRCGLDYIAVLFSDELGNSSLKVLDKSASVIDEISSDSENIHILDFGFTSADANILWTLFVDTSGEITVSTVTTYDLSRKSTTGVMAVQHQLVEFLEFTDNSIFVIGTNDLMRYNNNGNLIYSLPAYGYELIDSAFTSSKCMFLFKSRMESGALSTLKLYTVAEGDNADESILTLQLPQGAISASLVGGKILVCTTHELYTYSYSGTLLSTVSLQFALTEPGAIKVNSSEVLLASSPSLYRYKVK